MKKAANQQEKLVVDGKNKELAKNPKPSIQQNGEAQPAHKGPKPARKP
jgi:hypothetical protein